MKESRNRRIELKTEGLYRQRLMNRVETPEQNGNREQVKVGGAIGEINHRLKTDRRRHHGNRIKKFNNVDVFV